MKCPECFEEVLEGDQSCPYCGAELEQDVESDIEDEKGLFSILTVSDETEAFSIKDILENEGIPVLIRSHSSREMSDYDYSTDAWGEVLVNRGDVENSLALINRYMETQRELLIKDGVADDEEAVL
jgi:uncharacterized protein YbaR (Trm112 family)